MTLHEQKEYTVKEIRQFEQRLSESRRVMGETRFAFDGTPNTGNWKAIENAQITYQADWHGLREKKAYLRSLCRETEPRGV